MRFKRTLGTAAAALIAATVAAQAFSFQVWTSRNGDQNITSALIAAITGGDVGPVVNTSITTVGNGTLTAAGMLGGVIARTGPTGNFTDTTDTAANIYAGLVSGIGGQIGGNNLNGNTFSVTIKNATQYVQTINAGTGVTFSASNIVAPFSAATYFGVVGGTPASPTITFTHVSTVPIRVANSVGTPQSTALTTVGAGTITAGGIAGGTTTRSGPTAAFTDTTDTAANIIAASENLGAGVGASMLYRYVNNSAWPATLAGGSNVTLADTVPANSWGLYQVTVSSAGNLTLSLIEKGYFPATGTFVANGASAVTVAAAAATANSVIVFTLKTIGGTPAGAPFLSSITPGTGFNVKAVAGDTSTYTYEIRG